MAEGERGKRTAWRVRFSRFALAEAKPHLQVRTIGARTVVTAGSTGVDLDDHELIAEVAGRLDEASRLGATFRQLLPTMS